jgi:hypothetical protein
MLETQMANAASESDFVDDLSSYIQYFSDDLFFCTNWIEEMLIYFWEKVELFGGNYLDLLLGFFIYLGSRVAWLTIYITALTNALDDGDQEEAYD